MGKLLVLFMEGIKEEDYSTETPVYALGMGLGCGFTDFPTHLQMSVFLNDLGVYKIIKVPCFQLRAINPSAQAPEV